MRLRNRDLGAGPGCHCTGPPRTELESARVDTGTHVHVRTCTLHVCSPRTRAHTHAQHVHHTYMYTHICMRTVYMCTLMYTHTCVRVHALHMCAADMHACVNTHVPMYVHTRHRCAPTHMHTCTRLHTLHTCTLICMDVYTCVLHMQTRVHTHATQARTYTCMRTCTCTQTCTCAHTTCKRTFTCRRVHTLHVVHVHTYAHACTWHRSLLRSRTPRHLSPFPDATVPPPGAPAPALPLNGLTAAAMRGGRIGQAVRVGRWLAAVR